MSLIPLLLGRAATHAIPETAGPARYNPGGGHRPLVGVVAVGLPIALVVAVALSPFEMPIKFKPGGPIVIDFPAPPPPPPPEAKDPPPNQPLPPITAPPSPLPPVYDPPVAQPPMDGPLPPPLPPIGTDPPVADPPIPVPVPQFIEAKLDPRYKSTFQPDYPAYEQRSEIEGSVRVRVLVGADGRVKEVVELSSSSPGFFTETKRRALAKWRFKPATRGGTAEESWVTMTVRFELNRG